MGWAIGPSIGGPITQSLGDQSPYIVFCIIGIGVTVLAIILEKETMVFEKSIVLDIHGSTFFGA